MESNGKGVQLVEQVMTTGTSWIISRSKSHNGRIYYFNTLTGEATWNLSETEMERARRSMKRFPHQEDLNIGRFPEPSEPPSDQLRVGSESFPLTSNTHNNDPSTSHIPFSSTFYNKQIVNNQLPNQQFPRVPFIVSGLNVVQNMVPNVVHNPSNHLFPIAMNSSNTRFDCNVWAVPPPQQILSNPNLPLVNQGQPINIQFHNQGQPLVIKHFNHKGQPSGNINFHNQKEPLHVPFHDQVPLVNVPFTNQGQSTNVPFNNQDISSSVQNTSTSPSGFQRRISYNVSSHHHEQKTQNFGQRKESSPNKRNFGKFDLRKVLSARKMEKQTYTLDIEREPEQNRDWNSRALSENEQEEYNTSVEEKTQSDPHLHKEDQLDDGDWIEENFFVEDGKIKLNVTNLKKLAIRNMDPHLWYIVADKDILLNHLNFLNILCNSDDGCCLMVPQRVLAELQTAKESIIRRIATRAKRAVSFLLQHVDGENVVIGDANCEETNTRCDYLLNCCANLLEQKHHVVLLSEDEDFKTLKDSSHVRVYNMKELKLILNKPELVNVNSDRLKPPPCLNLKPIKITVTNDLASKPSVELITRKNNSGKVNTVTQLKTDRVSVSPTQETDTQKIKADVFSMSQTSDSFTKYTPKTGIQSDLAYNEEFHTYKNIINETNSEASPKRSLRSNDNQAISSDNSKTVSCTTSQKRPIKREIRLNRSISVKTSASAEETPVTGGGKKQFRWRRKKLASSSCSTDCKLSSATSSNFDENSREFSHDKEAPPITFNDPEKHQNLEVSDDSILSDVSSLKRQNISHKNVIVDETSTSGIISNTASNVDSESESGTQPKGKFVHKQSQEQKNVMFEVNDQRMEHSLRAMKDEWLSRYLQIMEEILTQVLRQDEQFLYEVVYKLHGGGPWTILEATECIKIKFEDYCDVLDAASKLSSMLSKISDITGRIIVNLRPSEFMEMYSYSVYLVEALMPALGNCEDLYTASQSLLKLLNDIKDPNLGSSDIDTFGDNFPQKTSTDDTHIVHFPQSPSPERAVQQSPQLMSSKAKMASCNLRSKLRTPENSFQKEDELNTKQSGMFIQDSFLPSLNLVKKISISQENSNTPDIAEAGTTYSQDVTKSIIDSNERTSELLPSLDNVEAKVIRTFSFCPKFENKTEEKNGKPVEREPLDMDQLDYSGCYENNDDYLSDDDFKEKDQNFDRNDEPLRSEVDGDNFNYKEAPDVSPQTDCHSFSLKCDDWESEFELNVNYKLNCFFSRIIADVKQSILDIKTFCQKTFKELSGPLYSSKRKCELHEKAEKIQVMIDNLCSYLTSIYCREAFEPENNIRSLLTKAGMNNLHYDDKLLHLYRDVIAKCFKQACVLQKSVAVIVTVVSNK